MALCNNIAIPSDGAINERIVSSIVQIVFSRFIVIENTIRSLFFRE